MLFQEIVELTYRHPTLRGAILPAILLRRRWRKHMNSRVDRVFDRLAELLAEDPVVKVAEFEGTFALSPRGALFRFVAEQGDYEPVLARKCVELLDPHRDAVDVGANIGFYAVLFAKRLDGRRVLAVEPTRNALARLRRNIALNAVESKTIVFEGVASNQSGWLEIKTVSGLEEFSSLGAMDHPSIAGAAFVTERVEARTLDELVADHGLDCGFVKVDVEGVEHTVFEGGRRTLAQQRPVVLSELSDYLLRKNGSSSLEVVRFFEALDYVVVDPLRPGEKPGRRQFGDILCLPREHPHARQA
jgi:FkbM family methyltransferase